MFKRRSSWFAAGSLLTGATALLLIGCAARQTVTKSEGQDDIAEYQQISREARMAFDQAVESLNQVGSCSNTCPAAVVTAYQQKVQTLEVESIKVRARAHAVLSRGDAYFEHWHENLARMKSAPARQLAEARRAEMMETFNQLKASSGQVREAFRPFLADLRKLRVALENDPQCVAAGPTRSLIADTQARATQCQTHIDANQEHLDALATLVEPIKAAARN